MAHSRQISMRVFFDASVADSSSDGISALTVDILWNGILEGEIGVGGVEFDLFKSAEKHKM